MNELILQRELILIKLGGSIITDKSREFTSRKDNILRLAKEIKEAQRKYNGKIIVGHGAGSFAHTPASKYQTKKGLINNNSLIGASVVEDAARKLNMIVVNNFLSQNLPVFSFSPASFLISDVQVCSKSYLDPLKNALEIGILPVVYGDVVMDQKLGFTIFSTEKVLAVLARELRKNYKIRMIYVTNVDGVYDSQGKTIPRITNKNFNQMKSSILGAKGIDVTGGMLHKVEEALIVAKKYKIKTTIINGNKKGNLQKAILGEKLTSTQIS
jgi:isopentenyl phosphate kinase